MSLVRMRNVVWSSAGASRVDKVDLDVRAGEVMGLAGAIGLMAVVAAGGIDLSAGPVAAVSAGIAQGSGLSYAVLIPLSVAAGTLCGLVNGILVIRTPVPPYLVTLALCAVLIGAAPGASVDAATGGMRWLDIPVGVLAAAVLAVIAHSMLTRTRLGLHVFFVGSNETTARLSGIRPSRVKAAVYAVSGMLAALGGALAAPDLPMAGLGSGLRLELTLITAVVIGGVSLSGGRGTVLGSVLGSVLCVQLLGIMDSLGVSDYGQQCGQLVLLLLVITYNEWRIQRQAGVRPA